VAVIRTKLFCTGPFGFGGTMGTGTTAGGGGGVLMFGFGCDEIPEPDSKPGGFGPAGEGDIAGPSGCANAIDATHNVAERERKTRFMARSLRR